MLTKNCESILDFITSMPAESIFSIYGISYLANKIGISNEEAIAACKNLDKIGFAEIHYTDVGMGKIPDYITLTEDGAKYKSVLRQKRIDYLSDKWIDFLALVVAIVAFIRTL